MAIGTLFAQRYKILGQLGKGRYGTVWRASDEHMKGERLVALKLLDPGTDPMQAYQEASVLVRLEAPHVLFVYDASTYLDVPYLSTKIAANGSAQDQLDVSTAGVRPDVAVTWLRHMLVGLASVHERGLLHRDVKPSNLFLSPLDFGLLGDFGVTVPLVHGQAPAEGDLLIRAPEMISTKVGSVASDIYSAGLTLYWLLAGSCPITGPSGSAIRRAIVTGSYPDIRDVAPHVKRSLADRVRKAMSVDPAARYASAAEMHTALAGDLVGRIWHRVPPDAGHERCWREAGSGTTHRVCVLARPDGRCEIETRRASGSGTRVLDHCHARVGKAQLASTLRGVFGRL
jgi:serine/threonine-protein kinase